MESRLDAKGSSSYCFHQLVSSPPLSISVDCHEDTRGGEKRDPILVILDASLRVCKDFDLPGYISSGSWNISSQHAAT